MTVNRVSADLVELHRAEHADGLLTRRYQVALTGDDLQRSRGRYGWLIVSSFSEPEAAANEFALVLDRRHALGELRDWNVAVFDAEAYRPGEPESGRIRTRELSDWFRSFRFHEAEVLRAQMEAAHAAAEQPLKVNERLEPKVDDLPKLIAAVRERVRRDRHGDVAIEHGPEAGEAILALVDALDRDAR